MRKLIVFNFITLDGFFEGTNKELDWHNVDEEFLEFVNEQLDSVGTLLFGRHTYQMMEEYWMSPFAKANNPITTDKMNTLPKIVFSTTLDSVHWNNTRLIHQDIEKEILELKKQAGKDLMILGSANLISSLQKSALIDEYRIMINPILLGNGSSHFKPGNKKQKLKLIQSRVFASGNVLLYYQPYP